MNPLQQEEETKANSSKNYYGVLQEESESEDDQSEEEESEMQETQTKESSFDPTVSEVNSELSGCDTNYQDMGT
jgi:hypothetical protein